MKGGHVRITLNDGTSTIQAIKWFNSKDLKLNELLDIAFYIELNDWRKTQRLQINILDIKKHNNIVHLQVHNNKYKCQLIEGDVTVTNVKGISIKSNEKKYSDNMNAEQKLFVKKILTFAEIALGKSA